MSLKYIKLNRRFFKISFIIKIIAKKNILSECFLNLKNFTIFHKIICEIFV